MPGMEVCLSWGAGRSSARPLDFHALGVRTFTYAGVILPEEQLHVYGRQCSQDVVDLFNIKPFNDFVQPLPPHWYP